MKKSTIISVALATSLILGSAFAESTNKTWKETKVYTVIGGESDRDHTGPKPTIVKVDQRSDEQKVKDMEYFKEKLVEVEVWSRGRKDSSKIPSAPKVKHIVLTGGETAPENGD